MACTYPAVESMVEQLRTKQRELPHADSTEFL